MRTDERTLKYQLAFLLAAATTVVVISLLSFVPNPVDVEKIQELYHVDIDLWQYRTEKMRNKGKCGKIWAWISK